MSRTRSVWLLGCCLWMLGLLGASAVSAQGFVPQWEAVGGEGFSANGTASTSLAFGPDGKPYVAVRDGGPDGKPTVMRLNDTGTGWEVLGGARFSAGEAQDIKLAFGPDSKPYVAYWDLSDGGKVTVMRLNSVGTAWEAVGGGGFSAGYAGYLSFAINSEGRPYFAYMGDRDNSFKPIVMRLNNSGTGWEVVGNNQSLGWAAYYISLAFGPAGRPYLAYQDMSSDGKASVIRLNDAGTAWESVGGSGFSPDGAKYTSLAFSPDGTPYVAYGSYSTNEYRATVMRLNDNGTGWEVVGESLDGHAEYTSLAFGPNGTPYVAYYDGNNDYKATVIRLNSAGTAWEAVGGGGFSRGGAGSTSLAFGPDGKPYVAFRDEFNGGRATVMRWSPSVPPQVSNVVASAGDASATVEFRVPQTSSLGLPITQYTVVSEPGGIDCPVTISPFTPGPVSSRQYCTATGLTNGTSYTFSVVATNAVGNSTKVVSNEVIPAAPIVPVTRFEGASSTGTGHVIVDLAGGGAACGFVGTPAFIDAVPGANPAVPSDAVFPHGLFDFIAGNCIPGSTIKLTMKLPAPLPATTKYWKWGPTPGNSAPHWYEMPANINGDTVVFYITDGAQGDDDLDNTNGTIVDQGGPGVSAVLPPTAYVTNIPTLSEWSLLLLGLLAAGVGARQLRIRN